ncbi:MAG: protease pro-enzyme activation domain-containing protein, partial [Acidobacteriota bacterium]|nr:protease pro-enzyme activation domain-containing protein [Acidobacteriota bacterium]
MTSNSFKLRTCILLVSILLPSLSVLAQTPTVRARVIERVDMQKLAALRGNVHPLARPEFDQGVAPDDLPMQRMLLVLQRAPEQETSLRQLLDNQQVKSSPLFHQWITPEQFGQQFGPADSDVQAVTDWLASQGFQVAKVAAGRTVIEFSGTAGLVRQVLGTEIHRFALKGENHWANTSDPQIPAALAPVVAGFASLNNFPRKPLNHSLGTFTRSKATGEVQPLYTYLYGGYYLGLGPTDFATIYNVLPLWNSDTDGTGQTIAVVGETNINLQDVTAFRQLFSLPANPPNIILNGPDPGITAEDETEADLDVQWSGAVAKGATIDFVVSESTETTPGIDLSALYIVDNNLAPVMSISYGGCEAQLGAGGNAFHSTLWEQAAAQGITVLIASGDSGSAGCDYAGEPSNVALQGLAVSGMASTPFNVAVGGTDFHITANNFTTYWSLQNNSANSSAKSYIPETTWNDSCAASGSRG